MLIPPALVQTILMQIVPLLLPGTDGDVQAAHTTALDTIFAYKPKTAAEFILAAKSVAFNLKSFETVRIAACTEHPVASMIRLESSAASLSREAVKAERQLALLQKARQQQASTAAEPAPAPAPQPKPQPAPQPKTATPAPSHPIVRDKFEALVAAKMKSAEADLAAMSHDPGALAPAA